MKNHKLHTLRDLTLSFFRMQPLASSRGRGIKLVPDPAKIPSEKACLVQHYVSNPHTINGVKVCCSKWPSKYALPCPEYHLPEVIADSPVCHVLLLTSSYFSEVCSAHSGNCHQGFWQLPSGLLAALS